MHSGQENFGLNRQPSTHKDFATKSLKIYLLIDSITALKLNYKTQLLLEKNEIRQFKLLDTFALLIHKYR